MEGGCEISTFVDFVTWANHQEPDAGTNNHALPSAPVIKPRGSALVESSGTRNAGKYGVNPLNSTSNEVAVAALGSTFMYCLKRS